MKKSRSGWGSTMLLLLLLPMVRACSASCMFIAEILLRMTMVFMGAGSFWIGLAQHLMRKWG